MYVQGVYCIASYLFYIMFNSGACNSKKIHDVTQKILWTIHMGITWGNSITKFVGKSGWETSARPLANASENLARRVEHRPGRVEFCIGYKRLPSSGECQNILVSQPENIVIVYD